MTANKFKQRLETTIACSVLIKTHEFTDYTSSPEQFQEKVIQPFVTHVIVSTRQGREFPVDPVWMSLATHVVHYEAIITQDGSLQVLRGLAQHIGLSSMLSDDDLRQIDYQLMTLPVPGDQATKLWSFHVRRGGRKCPPEPSSSPNEALPTTIMTTPLTNIFVTRHGARLDNGPDRDPKWFQTIAHHRREDPPLSPMGHQQAEELAIEIYKRCCKSSTSQKIQIFSSPHIRCLETADSIAKYFASKVKNDDPITTTTTIKVEPGIAEVGSTAQSMASQEQLLDCSNCTFSARIDTSYQPVMMRQDLQPEFSDHAARKEPQPRVRGSRSNLFGFGGSLWCSPGLYWIL